jgi:hypothetical protein
MLHQDFLRGTTGVLTRNLTIESLTRKSNARNINARKSGFEKSGIENQESATSGLRPGTTAVAEVCTVGSASVNWGMRLASD